jgi:hypothetical protein
MGNVVRCSACGTRYPDNHNGPCPKCGGRNRTVEVGIAMEVNTAVSVTAVRVRNYFLVHWRWYSVSVALLCLTPFLALIPLPDAYYAVILSLFVNLVSFGVSFLVGFRVQDRLESRSSGSK